MMYENLTSVRLMLERGSALAFLVLLSFCSVSSLNDEGPAMLKGNVTEVKYRFGSSSAWRNDTERIHLNSDDIPVDSYAVGLHRKLLDRFYNPYPNLTGNVPAATATPSKSLEPSPRSTATKSTTISAAPEEPSMQDASMPPPFVPLTEEIPPTSSSNPKSSESSYNSMVPVVIGCISAAVMLLLLATAVFFLRSKAGKSVNPWRTGLSGQLQKAFLTGVPILKRSEIEAACEDFSNVIGSCPIGTIFKGTLSSGVEIAVASVASMSSNEWSNNIEIEFRKKIETLSMINHKNFVNLLGYCEEDKPFTRFMVFEYAPNGTLFEHLHCKDSEHLDWRMRLRIAMGIAYCMDYLHQLNPPISHSDLVSSSIYLTEDYAVKVADLSFGDQKCPSAKENSAHSLMVMDTQVSATTPQGNVHSFGVLLFEMMTGKLPDSVNKADSLENGLADFLRGETLTQMADPTLESFDEKMEEIGEVIKACVRRDGRGRGRWRMREVTERLREITGISPELAVPKLSPLWWAELELLSTP